MKVPSRRHVTYSYLVDTPTLSTLLFDSSVSLPNQSNTNCRMILKGLVHTRQAYLGDIVSVTTITWDAGVLDSMQDITLPYANADTPNGVPRPRWCATMRSQIHTPICCCHETEAAIVLANGGAWGAEDAAVCSG